MSKAISKIDNTNITNDAKESFEARFMSVASLLEGIRKDYENNLSKMKNCDYTNLLERIVSAEKDLKAMQEKIKEIKENMISNTDAIEKLNISFQELSGSVNQLKLIIDEFKEYHKEEKANKLNVLFQLVIPIVLAVIFFFSGLFFKSCSTIHQQNIQKSNNTNNVNSWEYKNFESNRNK